MINKKKTYKNKGITRDVQLAYFPSLLMYGCICCRFLYFACDCVVNFNLPFPSFPPSPLLPNLLFLSPTCRMYESKCMSSFLSCIITD